MITRRALLRAGGGTVGLALLALPLRTRAEPVIEIAMRGNSDGSKVWFDPVGLLVEPGQTLRWINRDPGNAHTSTAFHPANGGHALRIPNGAAPWNSDYLLPDQSFDLRLTTFGVYDYFCIPHEEAGMVGRIVVGPLDRGPSDRDWPETARGQLPTPEEIVRRKVIRRPP
ncbi:plastocyanin/azurin family copper-binding protein [Azospirillum canadense]|uniref:plastocyanin/azurin family copper-binding protein n=1 Tax=Azospirillum canadense TaxID=403962 RepID=UPI0022266987|nr:plastocyanin/azurin family copper-binding protein [Azospirillum canadense]MCW2240075.1 plastocyanin [Azospirillum canadense]